MFGWLIDWLIDRMFGWLIDWLIECLVDWLIGWSIECSVDWLIGWSNVWLIDWLVDRMFGWLIDWLIDRMFGWLIDWLIECSVDWLIGWSIECLVDWLIGWCVFTDLPWIFSLEGLLDELENLEVLIDFCIATDGTKPTILDDYVPAMALPRPSRLGCLQKDLHALACFTIQLFSTSHGSANWPEFRDVKDRISYYSNMAVSEGKLPGILSAALSVLISADAFPYSAAQILSTEERLLPLPDYLPRLYQFVCSLDSNGKGRLMLWKRLFFALKILDK